jgi:hypothetical protein
MKSVTAFGILLWLCACAFAQDSLNIRCVWRESFWESAFAVELQGNLAYVATDAGLSVLDIADATHIEQIGSFDTPGRAVDVAIVGDWAYLIDDSGHLWTLDISNPAEPIDVSEFPLAAYPTALAINGGFAYILSGFAQNSQLQIIDISNPFLPEAVGNYFAGDYCTDICVTDTLALIAGYGLTVVNVSDPASPVLIDSAQSGDAWAVAVQNGYAYLACRDSCIRTYDVSNPNSITLSGVTPMVAFQGSRMTVHNGHLYLGMYWGDLGIFSLSNPAQPSFVSSFECRSEIFGIAHHENLAYVGYRGGLQVVNVSNPTVPVEAGYYSSLAYAHSVAAGNNRAYVGCANRVQALDVTDPEEPVATGAFGEQCYSSAMALSDGRLYVVDDECGLKIFDAAIPDSLVVLGSFTPADWNIAYYGVAVNGNFAYVGYGNTNNWSGGLLVFDVSNPAVPDSIGGHPTGGMVYDLAVRDSMVYLAYNGLTILNVSNPAFPTLVGVCPGPSMSVALCEVRPYAVTAGWHSLRVIDIADPAAPQQIARDSTLGAGYDVAVMGDSAYVADGERGLRVFNIADATMPVEIAHYQRPSTAMGVAVSGEYIFVAEESRLGIYHWIHPESTGPEAPRLPEEFVMRAAYPNPFNPSTTISYELPRAGNISLRVFDLLGREVAVLAEGFSAEGTHQVRFDASGLASGVYFARLEAGDFVQTRKLMLLR